MKIILCAASVGVLVATAAAGQSVPTDEDHRADVDLQEIATFLTEWGAEAQRAGTTQYSAEAHDGFIRVRYELFVPGMESVIDLYYDPERIACFAEADLLLCYAQSGFRKVTVGNESIDDKEFLFQQMEVTMRVLADGTYQVIRRCTLGECRDYE